MPQTFYQESSLQTRRQQGASYLQQLELPSLPPLSQMLTNHTETEQTEPQQPQNKGTAAATTAATAATTAITTSAPVVLSNTALVQTQPPPPPVYFDLATLPPTTIGTTTVPMAPSLYPTTAATLVDPQFLPVDTYSGLPTDPATAAAMAAAANAAAANAAAANAAVAAAAVTATNVGYGDGDDFHDRRVRQSSESSTSSADKIYSFVAIPGTSQKKRPRRRYDEIERLYHCNWPGCTKSYGTLNHLNAHVSMQKHGPKRHPSEFKEMRKEWRRQKKEREAARKTAEQEHKRMHEQAAAAAAAAVVMAPPTISSTPSGPFQAPHFQHAYNHYHPTMVLSGYY